MERRAASVKAELLVIRDSEVHSTLMKLFSTAVTWTWTSSRCFC